MAATEESVEIDLTTNQRAEATPLGCVGAPVTGEAMDDVEATLAAYQQARYRAEAAHEEFVAVLGRPDANVTEARAVFDRAEDEMRKARRWWWLALVAERQDSINTSGD